MPLPPPSLLLAMAAMLAASLAVGLLLSRRLKTASHRTATVGAFIAVVLLVLHATWLNGNPLLVRLVRSPDAIVWSNFSPLFVAGLLACAGRTMAVRWQRWLVIVAVSLICVTQAYGPVVGRVPATRPPRVVDGVHRQSTLSTCSAAAAATLLGTMGIDATEAEMADLCLTRDIGTLQLGLYRGLRLKAAGHPVEFLNGDFHALTTSPVPAILGLGNGPPGWSLLPFRAGHSVVLLGKDDDGHLTLADPMTGGRYAMTAEALKKVWTGEAMRFGER